MSFTSFNNECSDLMLMLKKKCTNIIIQSVLIEIHAGKKAFLIKISFLSYKNSCAFIVQRVKLYNNSK